MVFHFHPDGKNPGIIITKISLQSGRFFSNVRRGAWPIAQLISGQLGLGIENSLRFVKFTGENLNHMETNPVKVFIAYSRKDEEHLERLRKHLLPSERAGLIDVWYDGKIKAGIAWDETIREKLAQAEVVLLLLSADALASDYFYGQEVKKALERHQREEARVIPFILRPCDWKSTPLGALQAIPKDGLAVVSWDDLDDAYLDAVRRLKQILEGWRGIRISIPGPAALLWEAEPAIPVPLMNPLGDLSAYSCNRKEIIKRFWLNFLRNEEQGSRLQFYLMAGQQYGRAESMVKRLIINLKDDLKKRKKTVKCSPNLRDIVINELSIGEKDSLEDCRDLLRLKFNSNISGEVASLQDFAERIDPHHPAFSPAQYIPFAFKARIRSEPAACWNSVLKPALDWFTREFCHLEENMARRFLFFFIIGMEHKAKPTAPSWSWLGSILKKRQELEPPVFSLMEELKAFVDNCPVPIILLPPLKLIQREDLVEWFLPRTDDNERLAEEKAEAIIQLLREKRNAPQREAWHMDDVEPILKDIVKNDRLQRLGL